MIGFLTGISVNIVCNQIANLTGVKATGAFPLAKALDVLTHPGDIDVASLLTGLGALAILVLLARTRLAVVGALVALVIPTVVVILAGAGSVARVGDVGAIPRGVPLPRLPDFGHFSFSLLTGALAVAVIVLVQGAGVAEAAPNPDGTSSDANRDIVAKGAATGFRLLPWRAGGRIGRPDRAEREIRRADPVGIQSVSACGCW